MSSRLLLMQSHLVEKGADYSSLFVEECGNLHYGRGGVIAEQMDSMSVHNGPLASQGQMLSLYGKWTDRTNKHATIYSRNLGHSPNDAQDFLILTVVVKQCCFMYFIS